MPGGDYKEPLKVQRFLLLINNGGMEAIPNRKSQKEGMWGGIQFCQGTFIPNMV